MSQKSARPASPELFEQFRFMYGVLSRGDWDTYLAALHDDVEVHQSADILGTRGTFRGKQGALQAMAEITESFSEIDWNPKRLYDLGGGRYLMLVKPRVRGASSGIEIETEVGHLAEMRDGKIVRLDAYLGWDSALEAVGLSEQDAHADC
jgi:ketosteroid isomerase-like protein